MDDLLKELSAPFAAQDLEWRVGSTTKDKTRGMMLPYVTNRAIMNRLDEVLGLDGWRTSFREHHNGTICHLAIRVDIKNDKWLAKEDGASNTKIEPEKGGISDAMKRAAVQFGIGRYLYDAETVWVDLDEWGRPKTKPVLKLKKDNGKSGSKKQADDFIDQL